MNKKSKIITGVAVGLATLVGVGAVGLVSKGFQNWDVRDWVDGYENVLEVTDESQLLCATCGTEAEFSQEGRAEIKFKSLVKDEIAHASAKLYDQKGKELKLAMPLFWIEELVHDWIYPKYADYNEEYNFYSGKTTLRYYLYTKLVSWIHNFYVRTYNRYGYYALTINQQSGKMDGKPIEKFYYLSRKKVYSDTFATDCYGEYLADDVTEAGIDMLPCYADVVPSREEYDEQNSLLVENKLKNYSYKGGEDDG